MKFASRDGKLFDTEDATLVWRGMDNCLGFESAFFKTARGNIFWICRGCRGGFFNSVVPEEKRGPWQYIRYWDLRSAVGHLAVSAGKDDLWASEMLGISLLDG